MKRLVLAAAIHLGLLLSAASAHYLWVSVDGKTGEHGTANLYFEEAARPGDGQYLDPFVNHGKTWSRGVAQKKATLLKMSEVKKDGNRWLSAALTSPAPRAIESYGKWGVYRYGQTDILLHYYARILEVGSPAQMKELARSKNLALEVVPRDSGEVLELEVLWKGKPAASRLVVVRGPGGFRKNLQTDENGIVRIQPAGAGTYTFRTSVELNESGTDNGKTYQKIRHHSTLALKLPVGG